MAFTMISCLPFHFCTVGTDSKRHFPCLCFLLAHAFAFPATTPQRGTASAAVPAAGGCTPGGQSHPARKRAQSMHSTCEQRPALSRRNQGPGKAGACPGLALLQCPDPARELDCKHKPFSSSGILAPRLLAWVQDFSFQSLLSPFFQVVAHFLSVPADALSK